MLEILNTINWKKYTVNILIGYLVCWIYFFVTVKYFQSMFGQINGIVINYGISWTIWLIISYTLHTRDPTKVD